MTSLLLLASIVLAGYGMGWLVLRAAGLRWRGRLEQLTWDTAVGLGLVGWLLAVIGMVGGLYRSVIVGLTVLLCATGLWALVRSRRSVVPRGRGQGVKGSRGQGTTGLRDSAVAGPARGTSLRRHLGSAAYLACAFAAITCAAAALVGALAPPTAGDAMCYHLELPKQFLAEHALVYVPDSDNSTYPLLMEMLYLWGLALQGGVLAQLMHWLMGVLLAGAAVVLARPLIGSRAACLVGVLVLLVPGVTNQMTAPLNDLGLALYTTLATAAVFEGLRTGGRRWYALAGLCLGFAMGVKLLGALFALALGITLVARLMRGRLTRGQEKKGTTRGPAEPFSLSPPLLVSLSGRLARHARGSLTALLLAASLAALFGGGWYVRSYCYTGNPVYPFLGEWFGSGRTDALPQRKRPLAAASADVLRAPWAVTMHPERFGGLSHQLGVLFLALLPGALLVRRNRRLRRLLAVAGLYAMLWYLLRQNVRFLLPAVPLLSVAVVRVLFETRRFAAGPRWVMAGCVGMLVLFSVAIALQRVRDRAAVAFGLEPAEHYLVRQEPTFAVARWVNEHLRDDAAILSQDFRAFYFQRRFVRESIYRRRTKYDRQVAASDVPAALRARGFTHVLLAEGPEPGAVDATLAQLLAPYQRSLHGVFEHEYCGPGGERIHYRLVALPPAGSMQQGG